jgi:uncharacterized protein (TIGR03083 family)
MDTWEIVDAERSDFADLADSLTPKQWDAQSLCTAWKVRDVVAHVIEGATMGGGESLKKMVRYRFRLNTLLTEEAKKGGAAPTDALRADLRATIGQRTKPPGVTPSAMLADEVIHHQDIRRAIGVPRKVPPERLTIVLDSITRYNNSLIPAKRRVRGLLLKATDLEWTHLGDEEITGPAEALMMSIAGRPAALDELSGPGVETLRHRVERWNEIPKR